ncbi:MAG: glutamyl-tRNA reductase [Polyangiaceae bacterium]|nr:glutamyl-tRNA reductase [Polyangiaceae bacterium]
MTAVVGVSHRTAPIAVREQLAVDAARLGDELVALRVAPVVEVTVISTCNRFELVGAGAAEADDERVAVALAASLAARVPAAAPHLYRHVGREAVHHVARVAASLDSLVQGEPQILGQLKHGWEAARRAGTLGPELARVLAHALRTAKRVRHETRLGAGRVSVPTVAVELSRRIFSELSGRAAVLVGSGEMAEEVARLFAREGARVVVVGRNAERTREVARLVGGEARQWEALEGALVEADVVVTSTSAPGFVIDRALVARLRRPRRGRALFFVDLAVPRDVQPTVESLEDVFLYNVDDLSQVVAESLAARSQEAERAEQIVLEELRVWERRRDAAQAVPAIKALRDRFGHALERELERSLRGRLRHLGEEEREALRVMNEASLNRLLHVPSVRLRALAADPEQSPRLGDLATALDELFGAGGDEDEPVEPGRRSFPPAPAEEAREVGAHAPGRADTARVAAGRG